MRLKRWESPRREGRNNKGRGGAARQRQLKKQRQMLRQKLKEVNQPDNNQKQNQNQNSSQQGGVFNFPLFFSINFRTQVNLVQKVEWLCKESV